MRDDKGLDDKILAVSISDPAYADYTGLIDPATDTVSLKIGDWQALDQAALTKPLADALIYVHKSAAGAASPLKFWMDLDRDAWTFSASKADSSLVYGPRVSFELFLVRSSVVFFFFFFF